VFFSANPSLSFLNRTIRPIKNHKRNDGKLNKLFHPGEPDDLFGSFTSCRKRCSVLALAENRALRLKDPRASTSKELIKFFVTLELVYLT
jgi:hypothetical protein